jgi:hypothetical protein
MTLWYDDIWVAAIASAHSVREVLGTTSPAPPGFLLLLRAALALIGDAELAAQIVPLLASLAAIPLVGWIVARLTGSWAGGIAAASLVALDPRLVEMSVHVKQYAPELLVVTLLLAGYVLVTERPGSPGGTWLPIAAAAALCLMVSGNLAAVLIANLTVAFVAWHQIGRRRAHAVFAGVVFNGLAAALALFVYLPRRIDSLEDYWGGHFLPLTSAGDAWTFVRTIAIQTLTGAAPAGLPWLALLAVPGLVWLLRGQRQARAVGALALTLWATMLVAAALRMHPIGSRADIFADGVTLVTFAVGLVAVCRLLSDRLAQVCLAACATALFVLATLAPPVPRYFDSPLSLRVRELFAQLRPDDGLVIYPESSWLVAFYSGYPITFDNREVDAGTTLLPAARIARPGTLSLPLADVAVVRRRLDDFVVRGGFPRIFYFGSRMHPRLPEGPILNLLARRGYRLEADRRSMLFTPGARRQDAGVLVFVRYGGPFSRDSNDQRERF